MDVTLHFGAHRTATTTFQRMLGASGPRLRAAGIAYWGPKRMRAEPFHGIAGPGAPVLPWARRRASAPGAAVRLAMAGLAEEGAARLVVSEENMLGAMRSGLAAAELYPDAEARAARLAEIFGPDCRQVAIAIRSYDAWWASALAFALPRGGPLPRRALCRRLVRQPRRWRDVIADLAGAFPQAEIRVWTYEAMAARPVAVAEALLGPGLPALSGTRDWHNAQPAPAALRQHVADLGAEPDLVRETAGRFMPFEPAERRALQADYAADLGWLRSGLDARVHYIDDLGQDPVAAGRGRGTDHDGAYRRMA